ncbi:Uncharacterised protein [uncultured archaeon]|nr:Uncharacterised protein [uncultured archaeon]
MMDGYSYGWYPFMGIVMNLIWLIILIVIVYFVCRLIKSERVSVSPNIVSGKSAEDLLAERYVKGELTREQFMQMKDDLKKSS